MRSNISLLKLGQQTRRRKVTIIQGGRLYRLFRNMSIDRNYGRIFNRHTQTGFGYIKRGRGGRVRRRLTIFSRKSKTIGGFYSLVSGPQPDRNLGSGRKSTSIHRKWRTGPSSMPNIQRSAAFSKLTDGGQRNRISCIDRLLCITRKCRPLCACRKGKGFLSRCNRGCT